MSGVGDGTRIDEIRGAAHTGTGNQYNFHGFDPFRTARPKADPWRVAQTQPRWLENRFVPPAGFGEAAGRLAEPGSTLLLAGPPGSGRRTAAVMLLHRLGGDDKGFIETSFSKEKDDLSEPKEGERLLVDLTGTSEEAYPEAQELLYSFWGKVDAAGARLIAVLPFEDEDLLHPRLRQLVAHIGRPRESAVLRRHLVGEQVPFDPVELQAMDAQEQLKAFAMRDFQRLARLVTQARSRDASGGIGAWLQQAFSALGDRSADVAKDVAALVSGPQRALLLTVAMMHGGPADAVFHHTDELLRLVEHTQDERPLLERADLAERLKALPVDVEDSGGLIRFKPLAYDAAVRAHFWTYLPSLRGRFGEWVQEVIRAPHPMFGLEERTRLVSRFAEQSLRTGEWQRLQFLAEKWAAANQRRGGEAMAVLEAGLAHERYGAAFRAWIYDQSIKESLEPGLVQVLARACAEVMVRTHPDQALVRLHHLARVTAVSGPTDARDALFNLVGRDRRLYTKLLVRLGNAPRAVRIGDAPPATVTNAGIFLDLIRSLPESIAPEAGESGWRTALAATPVTRWGPVAGRWLSVARVAPAARRERLLKVLVQAADKRPALLSRLYLVGYEWAAGGGQLPEEVGTRDEVARRFWQLIDLEQGIEPMGPLRMRPSEERIP
ncbi:hypothetical protein ACFVXQ_02240 [Kitasatospora sp. NPDC058263]